MSGVKGTVSGRKNESGLVFLDIEMPNMNGFEFLTQCKQISFPVIFTTCYNQYAVNVFQISALD